MPLVTAEGGVLTEILDGTYPIWGEGLSRDAYEKWNRAQMATLWGRANLRRVALVDGGRVLASAKRYDLEALAGGRRIRVLGIGAVFTRSEPARPGARRGPDRRDDRRRRAHAAASSRCSSRRSAPATTSGSASA